MLFCVQAGCYPYSCMSCLSLTHPGAKDIRPTGRSITWGDPNQTGDLDPLPTGSGGGQQHHEDISNMTVIAYSTVVTDRLPDPQRRKPTSRDSQAPREKLKKQKPPRWRNKQAARFPNTTYFISISRSLRNVAFFVACPKDWIGRKSPMDHTGTISAFIPQTLESRENTVHSAN